MLKHNLRFFLGPDNCVVDSKNVRWVNSILHLFLPFNRNGREGAVHEPFADFSHAMVVTDGSAAVHDLVAGCIFNSLVHLNDPFASESHAAIVQRQVNIDGSTCLIELRHSERCPDAVRSEIIAFGLCTDPLVDFCAKV